MLSKEPSTNSKINLEADFLGRNAEALERIAIFADLSEGFTIGFAEVNLERDRNFAIQALAARQDPDLQWISLQFTDPDLRYLIAAITEALSQVEIIPDRKIILLISGLERAIGGYGDYPPLLSNLNIARDTYAHKLPYPMLFFLPNYAMTRFARFAPDFWAWKSTEVRFQSDLPTPERAVIEMPIISNDQTIVSVSQDRFDLIYRLLVEYPKPTLTRADLLNQLGQSYKSHIKYVKAEQAYQEALELYSVLNNTFGKAEVLNNLAGLYHLQGKHEKAEPFCKKALAIRQKLLGDSHPDVAQSLNNLAFIYKSQGKYQEAELLYKKALELRREFLGDSHTDVAVSLNNLAKLYYSQGKYREAELLYQQAIDLKLQLLGNRHPSMANSLNNLALLYSSQNRYEEAEPFYKQALELRKELLGDSHPDTASSLNGLAGLYYTMGRYSEAELLYLRALEILMKILGEDHPKTQTAWGNFRYLLQQALANGSVDSLSSHPLTQQLLQEMRE